MDESNNEEDGAGRGGTGSLDRTEFWPDTDEYHKANSLARSRAKAEAWTFKKNHIISELTAIEQRLIAMRDILNGSRTPCECCEDKKWTNEKEGRLKMELGGLISKVQRVSKRTSKVK
jgi:hypothetical protein